MSKKKQFQSKEAQAVAHVTEELNIFSDAIKELDKLIGDKGLSKTEKKLLQQNILKLLFKVILFYKLGKIKKKKFKGENHVKYRK